MPGGAHPAPECRVAGRGMKRRSRAGSARAGGVRTASRLPFVRGKAPSQHPRHNQGARRAGGAAWSAGRFKRPPKAAAHAGCRGLKWPACGGGAGAAIKPAQGPTQCGPPCQKRAAPTPRRHPPSCASRRGGGRHGHCHPCAACLDGQIAGGITAGGGGTIVPGRGPASCQRRQRAAGCARPAGMRGAAEYLINGKGVAWTWW